ncbi:hypothetical protein BOSE62_80252 [Bosea sp. 62]|nr:hypothetical protein BOSE7B_140001 [Bosea sp. 7B]CAD5272833.1 hypothetical protein BOSE21B_20173 [Bosea sp. 21B]CAD5275117.1 hypothetical protein BOSE46_20467 [Bosea sp. 46]VVT59210.1 hypothetical protein BOS5A_210001 [Bosea sp. EC-HK365B]VXC23372.1 hypothetical protein BOSE127_170553 [Bosea sp. 127]VXC44477.1 hypothetical protein BOSE29B_31009 [Bosea sp. 29B]VXC68324.1 hypothetical protein BOSE125_30615 [Bosea sp. 125]VXC98008.1 hypothetical protein BOSE62_80252 [Bosea sp. 62]
MARISHANKIKYLASQVQIWGPAPCNHAHIIRAQPGDCDFPLCRVREPIPSLTAPHPFRTSGAPGFGDADG